MHGRAIPIFLTGIKIPPAAITLRYVTQNHYQITAPSIYKVFFYCNNCKFTIYSQGSNKQMGGGIRREGGVVHRRHSEVPARGGRQDFYKVSYHCFNRVRPKKRQSSRYLCIQYEWNLLYLGGTGQHSSLGLIPVL